MIAGLGAQTLAAADADGFLVLFSGSGNGVLKSCYCPNAPWGGLPKRAWLVRELRQLVGRDRTMLVDSGDLFPVDGEPERIRCLLGLYRLMQYDAVTIGDQELPWCQQAAATPGLAPRDFPWLSASFGPVALGVTNGLADLLPWKDLRVGPYRVGVVAVTGDEAFRFATNRVARTTIPDPVTLIRDAVQRHRKQVDFLIVLSHQGLDPDRIMAAQLDGVDLLIGSHSQSLVNPPDVVHGIPILQAGKNAENLGLVWVRPRLQATAPAADLAPHGNAPSPFETARIDTTAWTMTSMLVPLNTHVDEHPGAAELVARYYETEDRALTDWLAHPPTPASDTPCLQIEHPVQAISLPWGATQRCEVVLRNIGDAPLVIARVRSKSRWVTVSTHPASLMPGTSGTVILEIAARHMDRFFRSEYTVTSNDPNRPVVRGIITGRVAGAMPDTLDTRALLHNLKQTNTATEFQQGAASRSTTRVADAQPITPAPP